MQGTIGMSPVSATEIQNNFGKYLQYAIDHGEVVILRGGKRVARLVSEEASIGYLADTLLGVLHADPSDDDVKQARTASYHARGEST